MAKKKAASAPRKRNPKPAAPARAARIVTGFNESTDALERSLLTGEKAGILQDYFGPDNYLRLRDLAREASTRSVRGGPRLLILPGIMGSQLARTSVLGDDVLWFDPLELALGRATELKLTGQPSPLHASGVIVLAYAQLKYRLMIAGYDTSFFAYDWRLSLDTLGDALAGALRNEPREVTLVAHSMGGLVARAALTHPEGKKISRLIMLGTPNHGSFVPVEVLRGTFDTVKKLAMIDPFHTPAQLAADVFNTFPGLCQMLPTPAKFSDLDLYNAANWPSQGPRPLANILKGVKPVVDKLAPANERFYLIAGVNQDTVTGLALKADHSEFVYKISPAGDDTVPLDMARMDGIPAGQTYYVEASHGFLPNNQQVIAAVLDLAASGKTSVLPQQPPPPRRAERLVDESKRLADAGAGPRPALGSSDLRHTLDAVAAPPQLEGPAVETAQRTEDTFRSITVGRRRQRRIDLTLVHGSLTEVDAKAYVLGMFSNVAPVGAALALDRRLEGAISEFTARRMFDGSVGNLFTIPVGGNRLQADMIVFAGLGAFDRFTPDVQSLVAEAVISFLLRTQVESLATVLMGSGSGQSTAATVDQLMSGFIRGVQQSDRRHRFLRLTLCETDAARYAELRNEIYRLAGTALFDEIDLTLDEVELPAPERTVERAVRSAAEPVYTIIRQEGTLPKEQQYRVSVLGSGLKAAVVSATRSVAKEELNALLASFDAEVQANPTGAVIPTGQRLCSLILPEEVRTVLQSLHDRHLVVVHDADTSRIPWETLTIKDWTPALGEGLTRRYLADDLPLATWLAQRRREPQLRLLLVVNPTGDLPGADQEGARIEKLAASTARLEVTPLRGDKASRGAILEHLRSGRFDCVHYAGHAFFDAGGPSRSGLLCARKEILSGGDLLGISNLPFLIFVNACESARVRSAPSVRLQQSFGVAEALMRGGVANYLGTYWPVEDAAAEVFATTFYEQVLQSCTLGGAALLARQQVFESKSRDWADYLLFGDANFVLKDSQ